jgi:CubicO group peptidase (beta-lactamase class C family)
MTPLLPLLKVGREYRYNGTGMELTCKALEAISGETLPQFYKSHLLAPLGCENTDIGSASHDAHSVPLEMAKIGQMLMQKGAYGDKRFFSEATFEQMLPKPVIVGGEPGSQQYGVGTVWTGQDGLSESTFSHGAASSATMWMDPANELVIIMTRNDAGDNFYQYHTRFAQLVVDSMIDAAPTGE